ncbi:hypothetical protein PsYK624_166460 [Phanerochaete sordida]|uniref:Uncharacterized protein n=1 Tax=Phanerochaete sordida TaxID=48140 RepID=A0A9P3LNA9_9APHY|nr:hypothetical protein PsYK624_166460 [Phanerochaete sordida]
MDASTSTSANVTFIAEPTHTRQAVAAAAPAVALARAVEPAAVPLSMSVDSLVALAKRRTLVLYFDGTSPGSRREYRYRKMPLAAQGRRYRRAGLLLPAPHRHVLPAGHIPVACSTGPSPDTSTRMCAAAIRSSRRNIAREIASASLTPPAGRTRRARSRTCSKRSSCCRRRTPRSSAWHTSCSGTATRTAGSSPWASRVHSAEACLSRSWACETPSRAWVSSGARCYRLRRRKRRPRCLDSALARRAPVHVPAEPEPPPDARRQTQR